MTNRSPRSEVGILPALNFPLDPKELEERLRRIDLIARTEYDTDAEAFVAVKQACFRLRIDIAKAAAHGKS